MRKKSPKVVEIAPRRERAKQAQTILDAYDRDVALRKRVLDKDLAGRALVLLIRSGPVPGFTDQQVREAEEYLKSWVRWLP